MDQELEFMKKIARARIADRPNMVVDGNPQEEIARALERHAERLREAAAGLIEVGNKNHLGQTAEGEAATHNIRVAAVTHSRSVMNTLLDQADSAEGIAGGVRQIRRDLEQAEREGAWLIHQATS